jgi:hypothetical protein
MSSRPPPSSDPTGRYKGNNYDPNYRKTRQADYPRSRSPHYSDSDAPRARPTQGYDRYPDGYASTAPSGGRPPWEERGTRERETRQPVTGRPPWEEREREGGHRSPGRVPNQGHMGIRESYIPPDRDRRNGEQSAHAQYTERNGTAKSNGAADRQPPRAYSPSAPIDRENIPAQLTSENVSSIPALNQPGIAEDRGQTLSESGVENTLDSLDKLRQLNAEVAASRERRATTELEPNKLALMAQSFLLTQNAPEPGEVVQGQGRRQGQGQGQDSTSQIAAAADKKPREQELKEQLLRAKRNESIAPPSEALSNLVKHEREDEPVNGTTEHKRPKAEAIGMNDTQRGKPDDGKPGPNYRPSEKNFVPERFRDASHEEVQRRAASAFAVDTRDSAAIKRKPDPRNVSPPKSQSLLQ